MTNISRLVSKARDGDQKSIRQLYDEHVEDVWRLSYRILQNRELAQDCSQEVFIKALNSLVALDDSKRFGAWLYRITYRKAIDLIRSERRHKADELDENLSREVKQEDFLLRRKLIKAIDGLDEIYRDVFVLFNLLDLQHKEIAAQLDIPEGSSKRRLSVARRQLRETLEEDLCP